VAGAEEALVKGDARVARVLERLLWLHAVRADEPLVLATGSRRWRLWPEDVREVERAVRGRALSWNASRAALAGALASALVRQQDEAGISTSDRAVERLSRSAVVRAYVDRLWPSLTPAKLVGALADRALLARACDGVLSEPEQEGLAATVPGRWSRADLPLLDEAAGLLDRVPGYAHVVVDEAQDLSAMQLRAVGRRCATGSATVLGDLAQGTTPGAPGDWTEVLLHLGKPSGRLDVLTTGYRVPREVLDLANRLLPSHRAGRRRRRLPALGARLAGAPAHRPARRRRGAGGRRPRRVGVGRGGRRGRAGAARRPGRPRRAWRRRRAARTGRHHGPRSRWSRRRSSRARVRRGRAPRAGRDRPPRRLRAAGPLRRADRGPSARCWCCTPTSCPRSWPATALRPC
jgi:hypothetical protein